jgi:hypothetical protein
MGRIVTDGCLAAEFTGWSGGTVFIFENGEAWKQVVYAYLYHYAYRPHASVLEEHGSHWLEVDGVGERIEVRRSDLRVLTEGYLRDAFKGWDGHTKFTFDNGEVWRQVQYAYHYHYAYRPHARVVQEDGGHWLEVDGVGQRLEVRRER